MIMRVIRPYGHTDIQSDGRYIQPKIKQNKQTPAAILSATHFQSSEKLLKSLYTSITDSYMAKPNRKNRKTKQWDNQFNKPVAALRLYLYYGQASLFKEGSPKEKQDFLGLTSIPKDWKKNLSSQEKCMNYLQKNRKYFRENQDKIALKNQFYGEENPKYLDFSQEKFWEQLAELIQYHYEAKLNSLKESVENNKNLLALSFNRQMSLYFFEQYLKDNNWHKLSQYADDQHYNLTSLLQNINQYINILKQETDENKQKKQKLHYKKIAPLMNAHNKGIDDKRIKDDKGSYPCEIKENQLYFYKMMVKEVLQTYFPKGAQQGSSLNSYEALREKDIHKKIEYRIRNKIINHFIRQGKFIFYITENKQELDYTAAQAAYNNNHLTSQLQLNIKQAEGFARQNLSALSFASMSLKNIVDNEGQTEKDLLGKEGWGQKKYNHEKFKLYYGEKWGEKEGEEILNNIRDYLHDLRNDLFHFRGYKNDEVLQKLFTFTPKENKQDIASYIKADNAHYKELIASELYALKLHQSSLKPDDYEKIFCEYAALPAMEISLPSFQKLLKRAENIKRTRHLPAAKDITTDNNDTKNMVHALLKNIYEHGFLAWLGAQKNYGDWVEAAINRTIKSHNNGVKKEDRKISQIPSYNHDSLKDYFAHLHQQAALENSTQSHKNRYISDKKAAKENANYVHNFITDFFIFAFQDYLKDKKFTHLHKIKISAQKATGKNNPFEPYKNKIADFKIEEKYHFFYLYLHLLNGDHLNHLRLQLIKLQAAQKQKGGNETAKKLIAIIDFYLKIKDSKLINIFQYDNIWEYFYKEEVIPKDDSFKQQASFIELSRFIGLPKLKKLFYGSSLLAGQEDIDNLKKQEDSIASWHSEAAKIHKKLVEKDKSFMQKGLLTNEGKEAYSKYAELIQKIENYKHIHKKVTSQYALKYHQFMLAIAGRLTGYGQLFERDLYFYLIGINYHLKGAISIDKSKTEEKQDDKKLFLLVNEKKVGSYYNQKTYFWQKIREKLNLDDNLLKSLNLFELYWSKDFQNMTDLRNDIAHFNYFIKDNVVLNFTKLINDTRQLMAYDRKLKNAVSKSIIDLCKERGLTVTFTVNASHELTHEDIKASKIKHVKNINLKKNELKSIEIASENKDYIALVKEIF